MTRSLKWLSFGVALGALFVAERRRPLRRQTEPGPPRMHGIHHSTRADETDSNYSGLFSCWDRLHRSLRLDVLQASVTIGVAGFSEPEDVTFEQSLLLPFLEDRRLSPPASR